MRRLLSTLLVIAASAAVLTACGSSNSSSTSTGATGSTSSSQSANTIKNNPANASKTVTIGSKNFTEEFILGQIYAQALKAAGYKVNTQLNLGSEQIALRALKKKQVDAYPEYTGTALTSFFKKQANDVPKNDQQAYQEARDEFAKINLTALPATPFTDSNGVGMTQKKASALGVSKISDLKDKAGKLTFSGTPECPQRPDCLLGLQD